ncbi:MAG: helix-turn-helix transcriptional regulator [Clostridia bacterium]|nr:helix-turn-helix transcriptional regulator [Clostridia bacterium]
MSTVNIAPFIKEYRRQHNLTQADFAKLVGVSPQAVSKWEREQGYPDITLLPTLACLFDCSVNDFFQTDCHGFASQ